MIKYLVLSFFMTTFVAKSNTYETVSTIVDVLKYVETDNNPDSIGDSGKSWGVLQIKKSCVDDVNRVYGTNYTHKQMFNTSCAKEVATLYLMMGIERYVSKYNKYPSERMVVRWYNGGIYKGHLYKGTLKYYNKYLNFKLRNYVGITSKTNSNNSKGKKRESTRSI